MSTNSSPPQYFWFPVLINGSLRYVPVAFSQFQAATMNGTEPENQQVGFTVENLGAPPVNPFELVLILIGLVANFVTLTSILCAGLINHNANKYIFILLMADTLYLLCSLADALQTRTLNFLICASISWMSSCCVYVSSLCVVMLSIERALAIFCPLEHLQLVYVNRWLLVTFCALPFLLWELTLTYVTIIDTSTDVYDSPDVLKCATEAKVPFEGLGALVSNCFQFLLPLTCVFFLNATIVFKIRYSSDMNFLKGSSSSDSSSRSQPPIELSTTVSSSDNSSGFWEGSQQQQQQQQPNRKSTGGKATAAASSASSVTLAPVPLSLFLVPLVYVLLNSPFYTIRFLKNSLNNDTASLVPWEVERTAYFLFLANFATNSIVYAFASPSFRRKIANWARKPVSSFQSTTGISGRRGG